MKLWKIIWRKNVNFLPLSWYETKALGFSKTCSEVENYLLVNYIQSDKRENRVMSFLLHSQNSLRGKVYEYQLAKATCHTHKG